jgi:hypothetical protein
MLPLFLLALSTATADVTIDLSKAEFDQESGHFCVMQKVRKALVFVLILYNLPS